jgi:Phosphoribosyl transferase/TRSP domain C terminus to PRTase_2
MQTKFTVELETGSLFIDLTPGRVPIKRLLGFAARVSSKRKFLLVSKVLGKHYPVSPRLMSWSYRALARAILKQNIGCNVLWIGMAETATGLGYGVFDYAQKAGCSGGLFIQTTRYHLDGIPRLEFQESHSHATDFFLYYPEQDEQQKQFLTAQTLVLIDDEISTGNTFLRLIDAYRQINAQLSKVFIVSLVNFAHPDDRNYLASKAGVDVEWICLREGLLKFEDHQNQAIDSITINVSGNGQCKKHLLAWPGRTGFAVPMQYDRNVVKRLSDHFRQPMDDRPILVLGSGECNAPAYLLGRELENNGFKVKVQSTSRSPIHLGNDIKSISRFEDNYQDGIPNFLYNVENNHYREIILCHETPLCPAIMDRLADWNAISAQFEYYPETSHATLHFFRP